MKAVMRSSMAYAIMGPPVGGLIAFLIGLGFDLAESGFSLQRVGFMLIYLPYAFFFGYVLGGVQAALVGAFVGIAEIYLSLRGFLVPLTSATLIWATFALFTGMRPFKNILVQSGRDHILNSMEFWLLMHVVPALAVFAFLKHRSSRSTK